jgi:hypothetical protein
LLERNKGLINHKSMNSKKETKEVSKQFPNLKKDSDDAWKAFKQGKCITIDEVVKNTHENIN